jgi:DNA-binding NarL/FixJ family response regulator
MIRLLVADDHAIVRSALVQLLQAQGGIQVVAEAASGEEVLQRAGQAAVDVVLLDLNMPGPSGVDLIESLRRLRPEVPVLVLSMHNAGPIVSRALRAGASGYVAKDSSPLVLQEAIARVAQGGRFIDPSLIDGVVFHQTTGPRPLHEALSARECQVLDQIVAGARLGDIADRLHVSAKTVSTHKMRIMQKLQVGSNAELVRYCVDHGLVARDRKA